MSPLTTALNASADSYRALLTREENAVIDCLLSGWNYVETAQELYTTVTEVYTLIAMIRHKLQIPVGRSTRMHVSHDGEMTSRESQVITLRHEGLKFKEIAAALGISYQTAKNHSYNVGKRRKVVAIDMPLPGDQGK